MSAEEYPKIYLYRRIVRAKLYIDQFFAEKIDLTNISDEAYFSKFHFIRLFKAAYGKTPHQYLKYVRIEKAKELLRGSVSVTEACFAVGFDSVSSFSGLFVIFSLIVFCLSKYSEGGMPTVFEKRPLAFVPSCYAYQHGWIDNSNFEEVNV